MTFLKKEEKLLTGLHAPKPHACMTMGNDPQFWISGSFWGPFVIPALFLNFGGIPGHIMTLKVRIFTPIFYLWLLQGSSTTPDLKLSQVSVTPDDGYHLIQFPTEVFDGNVSLFLFCF